MRKVWRGAAVTSLALLGLAWTLRGPLDSHRTPSDVPASKLQLRAAEREHERGGGPGFDEPDQFARILMEMRIPADRTEPEYAPGYRVRELEKARLTQKTTVALAWQTRGPGAGNRRRSG
jgi:hypothetical protein